MRWQGGRQSDNVEDRRGSRRAPLMVGGGGIGIGMIVLIVVVFLLGGDPMALIQQLPQGQPGGPPAGIPADPGGEVADDPAQAEMKEFVSVILADTEDVWTPQFRDMGKVYQPPKLVLFTDTEQSACGFADAAMGPFYCPTDTRVYLDMGFFRELELKHGAPGDFAQAYVIAHEVGHHVQHLLEISDQVHRRQQQVSKLEANQLSVRLELQADYLAGVWAHHANRERNLLEPGDVQEGLRAATAIGDDRLQKAARGYVVPDSFTHGSGEQRERWFRQGLQSGDFAGAKALFELDASEL